MKKTFSLVLFLVLVTAGTILTGRVIRHYGVTSCKIIGESMSPTYHNGDVLLMSGYDLRTRGPQKGDRVVFKDPDGIVVIKRIALVPGEIDNISPTQGWKILGRNQYVVLGDNATNSVDSRIYGPVHREQMIGIVK
jgi:signal peptidase I